MIVLHNHSKYRRRGMGLIQMLVYVAVITVLFSLCLKIFVSASRLNRLGANTLQTMASIESIGADFRDTLRTSSRIVPELREYTTGPETLILQVRPKPGEDARYAVFGPVADTGRFGRMVYVERDGDAALHSVDAFNVELAAFTFSYDTARAADARRIVLALQAAREEGRPEAPLNTFVAAVRTVGGGTP